MQATRYLPFGGYRAGSSPNPLTSHAYTSQRENMDIGLYYYNARYYAPYLNRFISADTLVPDPANPQAFNRYSYVLNSPPNYADPSGHIPCEQLPIECQIDSNGNEDWSIGKYHTESLEQTAIQVSSYLAQQAIEENPQTENSKWPDWTYTRWFPDYVIIQGSPPLIGILSFAITIDDYSNVYFSVGGNLSLPDTLSGSVRTAGGWILGRQEPTNESLGVNWNHRFGGENSPSEAELESYLTGWSGAVSAGLVLGGDAVATLSTTDPGVAGGELGLYIPQIGVGVNHGWFIYDSGSNTPWFWQKYWGIGLP